MMLLSPPRSDYGCIKPYMTLIPLAIGTIEMILLFFQVEDFHL